MSHKIKIACFFILLGLLSTATQSGFAQNALNFGNNFFVTGDYVVGGVGLEGSGVNGLATGTISIGGDQNPGVAGTNTVPAGAQIVAAILYWETVESSTTTFAGQIGYFRPLALPNEPPAPPPYQITGVVLGNPNAPVSWSSGGCSGSSQGSKTMRVYRADVRAFLRQDSNGNILPNRSYEVRLADSGSNGNTAPLTLGATLVIIYRVLSPAFPLNAVVIYDGAFAPSNTSATMTQGLQGFYQALPGPISKLTHIVGNGQTNKNEAVSLNSVGLPSLYPNNYPPFPGYYSSSGTPYNGSWDNPTWILPNANYPKVGNPVMATDYLATTMVTPSAQNKGCVSWGAVIFETGVVNSDNDGILDVWKTNKGYCDVAINPGQCGGSSDPSWVDLSQAAAPGTGQKDIFVQLDYMCSSGDGKTCNGNYDFNPLPQALANVTSAFSANTHNINVHIVPGNAIPEQTCTDNPPTYCTYPTTTNPPGVVGWLAGFAFLKNQPLNYPDESSCEAAGSACVRRFQHGRKDSYHYVISGHALGAPNWSLHDGSLTSVVASGNTVTFTTSTPHGLVVDSGAGNGRVTVADAITNPRLNGTYLVQYVPTTPCVYVQNVQTVNGSPVCEPTSFTIQIVSAINATYTHSTDPNLSVASGQASSASGMSDVGGQNSAITLGLWGADATVNVQSGTFMHELGHTLGLTHGGLYFDNLTPKDPDYTPTLEANCKPNFQSVMSYRFQVDLLDNGILDYSEEALPLPSGTPGLDEAVGVNSPPFTSNFYSTTSWYAPTSVVGGTPAKVHCDGTIILGAEQYYSLVSSQPTTSLTWSGGQDINFDGQTEASLRGYNDWANLDLRQIGAAGSNTSAGIGVAGSGGVGVAGSGGVGGAGSGGVGWAGSGGVGVAGSGGVGVAGSGGVGFGGSGGVGVAGSGGVGVAGSGGVGELTRETANSVARSPRNLKDTPTDYPTVHSVLLSWDQPTFGTATYNVYRGKNGATPVPPPLATSVTTTSYPDSAVTDCTTYTYFVTSVLASNGNESIPSNSVQYSVPCPPTGLTVPTLTPVTNNVGSVSFNWTAASNASGDIYEYKIYRGVGGAQPTAYDTVLAPATSYTDTNVNNSPSPGITYTYFVTAVLVNTDGCTGNSHCRESDGSNSQSILVHWAELQTITFAPLADRTYGNADFAVSATASSGLPVSFSASGNCTLTGTTVHIVSAGSCTITASQAGNAIWAPAPNVAQSFNIAKANATIAVTNYSVTYDGNPHTATGTATGVFNEPLSGLNLSGTTHTNAGTYTDAWTFTDVTGNYNNANGVVTDSIAKANAIIVVVAYSVTYDGNAHTATGSATGVKGEALSGLNLSGTIHTNPGTYSGDVWTFTDVTGNYNNANGVVTDIIIKGNSITTITSIAPSPSILGQSFTVNFTVTHVSGSGTPSGNVTLTDVSGATCTGTLAGGIGSCVLKLPEFVNGTAVVGTRTITANYGGDSDFTASSGIKNQQVIYTFSGFYPPLSSAGASSYSGAFNIGKSVTAKWNLQDSSGTYLGNLNANTLYATGPYAPFASGPACQPMQAPLISSYAGMLPPNVSTLYSPNQGAKGGSTFRISSSNNQFIFNWDTTGFTAGCYVLEVRLDSGQEERTALLLQ